MKKQRFCTTTENYQRRLQGFSEDELPRTFRDAVQVTRALGKQLLWIGALCIIQAIGDEDEDDWRKEAGRMERVFMSACLTIAASSAQNWKVGFLDLEDRAARFVQAHGHDPQFETFSSCLEFYGKLILPGVRKPLPDASNDFKTTVDSGPLNQPSLGTAGKSIIFDGVFISLPTMYIGSVAREYAVKILKH